MIVIELNQNYFALIIINKLQPISFWLIIITIIYFFGK